MGIPVAPRFFLPAAAGKPPAASAVPQSAVAVHFVPSHALRDAPETAKRRSRRSPRAFCDFRNAHSQKTPRGYCLRTVAKRCPTEKLFAFAGI